MDTIEPTAVLIKAYLERLYLIRRLLEDLLDQTYVDIATRTLVADQSLIAFCLHFAIPEHLLAPGWSRDGARALIAGAINVQVWRWINEQTPVPLSFAALLGGLEGRTHKGK